MRLRKSFSPTAKIEKETAGVDQASSFVANNDAQIAWGKNLVLGEHDLGAGTLLERFRSCPLVLG